MLAMLCLVPMRLSAPPSLTLTLPAAPVSRVLAEISRQGGTPLQASADLQNQMVCLRLQNASLDQTMAKLAVAFHASWEKEKSGYRLLVTEKQKQEERDEDYNARLKEIKKELAFQAKRLAALPEWSSAAADQLARQFADSDRHNAAPDGPQKWLMERQRLVAQCPGSRIYGRLVAFLDPEELARLDPDVQTVWSSDPNPMERSLDSRILSAVYDTVQQDRQWREARERFDSAPNPSTTAGCILIDGVPVSDIEDPISPPARVVLIARPNPKFFPQLDLLLVGAEGHIDNGFVFGPFEGHELERSTVRPPHPKGISLEVPSEIRALAATLESKPAPEPLRGKLLDPERFEFLSLAEGRILLQLAQAKDVQLVAALADEDWKTLIQGSPVTCERDVVDRLAISNHVDSSAGWLIIRPLQPGRIRRSIADRRPLGSYLRSSVAVGHSTLEARAEAKAALANTAGVEDELLRAIRRNTVLQVLAENDPDVMRFYGSLSEAQRTTLPKGLPISALTSGQTECLRDRVFGDGGVLQAVPVDNSPVGLSNGSGSDLIGDLQLAVGAECFPNGLPTEGYVRLTEKDEYEAIAPGYPLYLSPEFIAATRVANHFPGIYGGTVDAPPNMSRLQYGFSRELTFTFRLTPRIQFIKTLSEHVIVNETPAPYGQLPATFRDQVDKEVAKLKPK